MKISIEVIEKTEISQKIVCIVSEKIFNLSKLTGVFVLMQIFKPEIPDAESTY